MAPFIVVSKETASFYFSINPLNLPVEAITEVSRLRAVDNNNYM